MTQSPTQTRSLTPSLTQTRTITGTATGTQSSTRSRTPSQTFSFGYTYSITPSASATITQSQSASQTGTQSQSITPTLTVSQTMTASSTMSPSVFCGASSTCGGAGVCNPALPGTCTCSIGYVTANCSLCDVGFVRGGVLLPSGLRACTFNTAAGVSAFVSLTFTTLAAAGAADTNTRALYLAQLASDLAFALSVPASRVLISAIDTAANVVTVGLLPATPLTAQPYVSDLVATLARLISIPGPPVPPPLYTGQTTAFIDPATVLSPVFLLPAAAATVGYPAATILSRTMTLQWNADATNVYFRVRTVGSGFAI
jgi:predicted nucleic acid binding AN1-type Zn finger protein